MTKSRAILSSIAFLVFAGLMAISVPVHAQAVGDPDCTAAHQQYDNDQMQLNSDTDAQQSAETQLSNDQAALANCIQNGGECGGEEAAVSADQDAITDWQVAIETDQDNLTQDRGNIENEC